MVVRNVRVSAKSQCREKPRGGRLLLGLQTVMPSSKVVLNQRLEQLRSRRGFLARRGGAWRPRTTGGESLLRQRRRGVPSRQRRQRARTSLRTRPDACSVGCRSESDWHRRPRRGELLGVSVQVSKSTVKARVKQGGRPDSGWSSMTVSAKVSFEDLKSDSFCLLNLIL